RRIRTDPAGRRQLHHAGCQRREPGGGAGEAERGRKRRQWSTRPTVAAQPVSRRPDRGVTPGGAESAAARSGTVRQPERRGPDRARARRQPLSRLRSLYAGELRPMKHLPSAWLTEQAQRQRALFLMLDRHAEADLPAPLPAAAVQARLNLYQDSEAAPLAGLRSEEHTSELQSRENLVCRLLL